MVVNYKYFKFFFACIFCVFIYLATPVSAQDLLQTQPTGITSGIPQKMYMEQGLNPGYLHARQALYKVTISPAQDLAFLKK